jgi:hypothetical protein
MRLDASRPGAANEDAGGSYNRGASVASVSQEEMLR